MNGDPLKSLDIAARTYWSRPTHALVRAFMLEAYARVGLRLEPPLADLGCGDSLFAGALADRGVIDRVDLGLDYLPEELVRTVRRPRLGVVRGDLRYLPFAAASLGTAMCNTVLSSLVGDGVEGVKRTLAEIHRALRPGGHFVCSVATPAFVANTAAFRLARRLGCDGLACRIEARISRRNDHTLVLDRTAWVGLVERAGFRLEACRPIAGRGLAELYRWLALVKGGDVTRRLGLTGLAPAQGAALAQLLRLTIGGTFAAEIERLERGDPAELSFLLLVSGKI